MGNSTKVLKIAIAALVVFIVAALGGLGYGISAIYRLRTGEADFPMYTINEIVELQEAAPQEITGEALRLSIAQRGMHYAVIDDYLYYANPDRNRYMYRFNLETDAHELYLQVPVFGVITDGEKLFFMAIRPQGQEFSILTL